MVAEARWRFIGGLAARLADVVGSAELLEVTVPPPGLGLRRTVQPASQWIGTERLPSTIPLVIIAVDPPVDARLLAEAWGLERPVAVAVDVHQSTWALLVGGEDLPDPYGRRIAADPFEVGPWAIRPSLTGRPPGELPGVVSGASPAYDVLERGGEVRLIEIQRRRWRTAVVSGDHPDARALLGSMASFYPAWRAGWAVANETPFVVVYDGERPVAGAAIDGDGGSTVIASRLCVSPGRQTGWVGSALLDAVEAVAMARGATRLRLDGSAFLASSDLPYQRHGYVVGPPYDGDADEPVWVEREIREPSFEGF